MTGFQATGRSIEHRQILALLLQMCSKVMPHQPTVSEETEFDGRPRRLPDQNAILVGRVGGDTAFSGLSAYYIHGRGDILLGRYTRGEFLPEYAVGCESKLMSACVRALITADAETELSSVGKALLQAWHFGELTTLSHKQAHVYALRENAGFGRDETAAILNLSPSTVDTHLQRAREKLAAAKNLIRLIRTESDELTDLAVLEQVGSDDDASHSTDVTPLS